MNRAAIVVLALPVAAGISAAQCGTGISGAITDSETGQKIRGAVVTASGPNGSGTGAQGCCGYKIRDLEPGMYWVTAAAGGYLPGEYPDSVEVVDEQMTTNIDIALEPDSGGGRSGSLSGKVTDAGSGCIIRHATVTATSEAGSFEVGQCCHGYKFCELEPGTYWVTAEAGNYFPGNYPDSVTVAEGQSVEGIDFDLEPDDAVINPMGLEEEWTGILSRSLRVTPNPADQGATVRFEQEQDADADVLLTDVTGRTLWSARTNSSRSSVRVETAELANGIYLIAVRDAQGAAYRKLIVEH